MTTLTLAPEAAARPSLMSNPLPVGPKKYAGGGRDILLQGFHWHSHKGSPLNGGGKKSWYRIIADNAEAIKAAGFTIVWFPAPSDSAAPEGYLPRRWNLLDTSYGSEAELRAAIEALAPIMSLADVVLNHRVGVASGGVDFEEPRFRDNHASVTCDDECGEGRGNRDTGDGLACGRDLDHTNPDVRVAIKEYLHRLKNVGFAGWRYDLAKGYTGTFIGEYNDATEPAFSVGEYFDGDRQSLVRWIDSTGGKSAAFDFPTRFQLFDSCTRDDYSGLRSEHRGRQVPGGLIGVWPSRAVTFLDNHDTETRRGGEHGAHFPDRMVAMGYAYLLTHPGVPSIFWSHFFDWDHYTRQRIERLIQVRRSSGIHSRSSVAIHEARHGLYAAIIDDKVAIKMGSRDWGPGPGWRLATDGDRFAVWIR